MNNKPCYQLNFSTKNALAFKDEFLTNRFGKKSIEFINEDFDQLFSKKWMLNFSKAIGPIACVMIFSRPTKYDIPTAHVDLKNDGGLISFAINWIVSGEDSEMVWYESPENLDSLKTGYTEANTPYRMWPAYKLNEQSRYKISSKMVIVRTDIPHRVIVKDEPRIAISIRIPMGFRGDVGWDRSVDFFRSQNLLKE